MRRSAQLRDTVVASMQANLRRDLVPLLVRWMLVLEDSDADRLYFGKGLPSKWVLSRKPVSIAQAPTRFGRVDFTLTSDRADRSIIATVHLARPGTPGEIQVKLRTGRDAALQRATVNGGTSALTGAHRDTVVIDTRGQQSFTVIGYLA
jgi:hypothetical protein